MEKSIGAILSERISYVKEDLDTVCDKLYEMWQANHNNENGPELYSMILTLKRSISKLDSLN